ncbi:MAG TPA: hypothetical protein VJ787_04865 [Thermoleophilia bacterium]|nr:hypothetical protein [Thermoleophilia bacterium]
MCGEDAKNRRGCRRPGERPRGPSARPYVFTSQPLADVPLVECPTGLLLREAPWVYDVLEICSYASERGTPSEITALPAYMRQALHVFNSETTRLRELDQSETDAARRGKADADYARRVLSS